MKMRAPEGVISAAVESTQYEVDADGHIEVENGEHIPHLERHGFVQVADPDGDTHSEPQPDEIGPCPDFSKFVNRQALVDWLAAHQNDEHRADENRAALEAACVAQFELVAAGEAHRVHPEGEAQVEETEGDGDPDGEEAGEAELESEISEATQE